MATLPKIRVPIVGDETGLKKALSSSVKRLQAFGQFAVRTGKIAAAGLAVAGAAITGGVIAAVNSGAEAIDKLAKKARSLGVLTEELQRLRYAADLSGVSNEALDKSFQRMLKTVGDAKSGLSTATDALDIIGLSVKDLEGLKPSEQFRLIAEGLGNVDDKALQTKAALDIFGRSGSDLINLFGSDIGALLKDFDDLNIGISESQAAAVESFNDSKTRLKALFGGFKQTLTTELAGPFEFVIEKVTQSIKDMGGMQAAARQFAGFIIAGMKAAVAAISGAIRFILQLRGFLLSAKLLAISVGETVAANIDRLKESAKLAALSPAALIAKGVFGDDQFQAPAPSAAGDATAQAILENNKLLREFSQGEGGFQKFIDDLNKGLDDAFTQGAGQFKEALTAQEMAVFDANKLKNPDGSRDFDGIVAAVEAASKVVDSNNKLADAAKSAAEVLDEVSKSKAWQDIFGAQQVTARAYGFDEYAKLVKSDIESNSQFAQSNLDTLRQILQTAKNNQGQVFTNESTFGNVDLQGMADVIRGLEAMQQVKSEFEGNDQNALANAAARIESANMQLTDKLNTLVDKQSNTENVGSLSIDLTTDTGRVAGEIFAEPQFLRQLQTFINRQTTDAARAAVS